MKHVDIDPKSIDLEEAYCMCSHKIEYAPPEGEGKPRGVDIDVGDIFGFHNIELYRRLTEKDLADKNIDWDYYDVGCMTHRWNNVKNAIACAKKVIKLRFKNYGKISVDNKT